MSKNESIRNAFLISQSSRLKHDYDVIHCSFRTLYSPKVQITLTVQNVPNESIFGQKVKILDS